MPLSAPDIAFMVVCYRIVDEKTQLKNSRDIENC